MSTGGIDPATAAAVADAVATDSDAPAAFQKMQPWAQSVGGGSAIPGVSDGSFGAAAPFTQPGQTQVGQLGSGLWNLSGNPGVTGLPNMPLGSGMSGVNSPNTPNQGSQGQQFDPVKAMQALAMIQAGDKAMHPQTQMRAPSFQGGRGGAVNFMPSSAITMPYQTGGSTGLQSILQQMNQANPYTGR